MKKCIDCTPDNYLQVLEVSGCDVDNSDGDAYYTRVGILGDGELSKEYTQLRQKISEEVNADIIQRDTIYATEIAKMEQEEQKKQQEELARRDAALAKKISEQASSSLPTENQLKRPYSKITTYHKSSSTSKTINPETGTISSWLIRQSSKKKGDRSTPSLDVQRDVPSNCISPVDTPFDVSLENRNPKITTTVKEGIVESIFLQFIVSKSYYFCSNYARL